jgi:hypothetical protein
VAVVHMAVNWARREGVERGVKTGKGPDIVVPAPKGCAADQAAVRSTSDTVVSCRSRMASSSARSAGVR